MPGNMNINRLLSRRDKDGSTHRRDKSRDKTDKSSDQKVTCLESLSIIHPPLISPKSFSFRPSVSSISAAFPNPRTKCSALLQTTYSVIQTTSADSRPGIFLQTRPLSGDGITSLFKSDKSDSQKATAKEADAKVISLLNWPNIKC
jgi:hypothetical protein